MLKKLHELIFGKNISVEFRNRFGEKQCPVCSFNRIMIQNGMIVNNTNHKCPENSEKDFRGNI